MPAYTGFDASGVLADSAARNVATTATTDTDHTLWNYSGSPINVSFLTTNVDSTVTRASGAVEVISTTTAASHVIKLDADEVVHVNIDGTGAGTWRVNGASTEHGLAIRPGSGHTPPRSNLVAGLYLGNI